MARQASPPPRASEGPTEYTAQDKKLARELLIELLTYQFASPVRWIETQDHLFSKPDPIQRMVDIGPGNVLQGLASKTLSSKYAQSGHSHPTVLSHAQNHSDLYHEYPPEEEQQPQPSKEDESSNESKEQDKSHSPAPVEESKPAPAPQSAPKPAAQALDDVPVPAEVVLRALVSQKLKQSFEEVSVSSTIKDMCGGKSTLQNEIIGEIGAEFGGTPDSAEDKSIPDLAAALASSFNGSPGKHTGGLISKLISSKMPGGFNMSAAKDHLETNWGLGSGRQNAVLLMALTAEPASRLGSTGEAKEFLDSMVSKYANYAGVTPSPGGAAGGGSSDTAAAVDPEALKELKAEQESFYSKQLDLLAKQLGMNLNDTTQMQQIDEEKRKLQEELDLWYAEHGDTYASGIKPSFDSNKLRQYDSWWNWARQDVISLFNELAQTSDPSMEDYQERLGQIANRANQYTIDLIQWTLKSKHDKQTQKTREIGRHLLELCQANLNKPAVFRYQSVLMGPKTTIEDDGTINYSEVSRHSEDFSGNYLDLLKKGREDPSSGIVHPFAHICNNKNGVWQYNRTRTEPFLNSIGTCLKSGISFQNKTVLVTGAGPGSIGAEVVRGLLAGGAKVIVTTSRPPSTTAAEYQAMYAADGGRGSELRLLPFNQASAQDCDALVEYIYSGLELDLDAVIPFAAISEAGRELDSLDSKSELAHRLMLVNLLRLLGNIKQAKETRNIHYRPAQVILPLSPNHGTFGGDGLYSESKLGLETLFNRWTSESWDKFLSLCGAVIGWTRGTGLMNDNNIVAEDIESNNVITFSQKEMACNILNLMSSEMVILCQESPLYADLNGGLQFIDDLKTALSGSREKIMDESNMRKAVAKERETTDLATNPAADVKSKMSDSERYRALHSLKVQFPDLPKVQDLYELSNLRNMVDLSRIVVVVGYSELGPWGNARTRWDQEAHGKFSKTGYIEIAWIMGLIKHFSGNLQDGSSYIGWVDSSSGDPVADDDIEQKYGEQIHEHSGVRVIEPEMFRGYSPENKEYLIEVAIEEDMEPFEASKETADAFKRRHGDNVIATPVGDSEYKVQVKKGATLWLPKSEPFTRLVAGQIPAGWDPKSYGIPDDIVKQVDPVTLYTLCCVSEAFLSAGIKDPYEMYKFIHISEVGNCIGSGIGGAHSLKGMFKDRFLDREVASDVLQETFINTTAAWVNMLLLGSAGPIKTPVGACATALESLDIGFDAIASGKAKLCLVGGADDFTEELSQEFANMKATSNARTEIAAGRLPSEMSRPTATSRAGFMESHGAGCQIVTSAELALEMGLPIYGVIASTAMAGDKIGRSVPAPGQGILANAKESYSATPSPLLDIEYRRKHMEQAQQEVLQWQDRQIQSIRKSGLDDAATEAEIDARIASILKSTAQRIKNIKHTWGNNFAKEDPTISPLREALAVWNLTIDDLDFATFHGTSTQANDKNESDVISKQFKQLGRSKGNAALCVFQKSLTGHPLGAAGAWMLNGALQAMNAGIIPGNMNADNVDPALARFDSLVFPSRAVHCPEPVKAFSVTSFGFGQKGAQAIGVNPRYLYATLPPTIYQSYAYKVDKRQAKATWYIQEGMMRNNIFVPKDQSPYPAEAETSVLMDPTSRIYPESERRPLSVKRKESFATTIANIEHSVDNVTSSPQNQRSQETNEALSSKTIGLVTSLMAGTTRMHSGIGVDIENVNAINSENEVFIERNFTAAEQEFARSVDNTQEAFSSLWTAKEAAFKSMGIASEGAAAALRDVEVLTTPQDSGAFTGLQSTIIFHGSAEVRAKQNYIGDILVASSTSNGCIVSVAVAYKEAGTPGV